jgi:tellurite resistance protein TerC
MGLARSVRRSIAWISLGVMLGIFIWIGFGHSAGSQYFYGFFIEKSLSVDNIFVWGILLTFFKIPKQLHYNVLFWGILGAMIFRTIFIVGGTLVIDRFQFVLIILGLLLMYSAYGLFKSGNNDSYDPNQSKIVKAVEKYLPFTSKVHGTKLFVKENGRRVGTLLLLAIFVIELTDILFAIDSVPAVLAVIRDPYIAIASNIAAILGLRALYFVFENIKDSFWLLNYGLAVILGVLGVSLLFEPTSIFGFHWFGIVISSTLSLIFVLSVLTISITASLVVKPKTR